MEVVCIETEAFYALVEQVVGRLSEKDSVKTDKWIDGSEAMDKLGIRSTTTLQTYRDEGKIRFSQSSRKHIMYDSESIEDFLEKNAHEIS